MFSLLSLAVHNLWRRNQRRTVLTIFAVASATVVFCALMVLPYVTDRIVHFADSSPRLVVMNRSAMRFGLPESYYNDIVEMPGVMAVNRMVWFAGVYDDPHHQFPTVAIDADNPDIVWPEDEFSAEDLAAFKAHRNGAIVGAATMNRFGWKIGQNIILRSQLYPVTLSFMIVGSYKGGPDTTAFMFRRDYLEAALHNPGKVDMLWVRCVTAEASNRIAREIDTRFRNSGAETETQTERAFLLTFLIRFQSLGRIVEAIGLCAVIALALAVLNSAAMTIRERRNEIAVLRTLGFLNFQILAALALEAVITALAGGLVGTLLATAAVNFVRGAVPSLGAFMSFGMPYPVVLGGIAMALVIGVTASISQAATAVRAPVYESLRHIA